MEKSILKQVNDDLKKENAKLKKLAKSEREYATELTNESRIIINGLCDTIDVKDAKLAKAGREGIVKLKLRDKLLKIFNVVVED